MKPETLEYFPTKPKPPVTPAIPANAPKKAAKPPSAHHKSHWVTWLISILILAGAIYWVFTHAKSPPPTTTAGGRGDPSTRPIPVVAARAELGDVPIYLGELGTVTPFETVTVRAQVTGQLMKINFQEGHIVHQGDVMAEIDPRPYQAAMEAAVGKLAQDQANLSNAKVDLKRYQDAPDVFPEQTTATQQTLVAQYQGTVQSDQANIDSAKVQLDFCKITAPITGLAGLRQVDVGNIVHTSDTNGIDIISELQPIAVVFPVVAGDIGQIMSGASSVPSLPVDAWDDKLTHKIASGKLEAIDSSVNPATGTVMLKARFENKDSLLFPGQFVNVKVLVDTLKQVVVVPDSAVQNGPNSTTFVYLVGSDRKVSVQNVTLDPRSPLNQPIITSGLSPGDVVVTDGVDKLQPGSRVVPNFGDGSTTQPSTRGSSPGGRGGGRRGGGRGGRGGGQNAPTDSSGGPATGSPTTGSPATLPSDSNSNPSSRAASGESRTAAADILAPVSSLSRLARISANTASSRRLDPGAMLRRISLWDFDHRLL
jgi:multidrug efflux system membrane fusion protein